LRDEARRTPHQQHEVATESRRLLDAKASYDAMLADMNAHDRAIVERLMTSEMTMLMLAVSSAAADLVIASHQEQRSTSRARMLEPSLR
jgi:hypothetical protein